MKPVRRHRTFTKHYAERIAPNPKLVRQFEHRFAQFLLGERALLKDHALTGHLSGDRAFSVTGDIRVIYAETEHEYILYDIGSHNQVY